MKLKPAKNYRQIVRSCAYCTYLQEPRGRDEYEECQREGGHYSDCYTTPNASPYSRVCDGFKERAE